MEALPGRILGAITALPGEVASVFSYLWSSASHIVSAGASAVVGFFTSLPGRISALAGRMLSAGSALIQAVLNGLRNVGGFVGNLSSAIVGAVKGGINSGIDIINSGINGINAGSGGILSIPDIPHLAAGAILNQPTLALIGEAGPEVVIPLSNSARANQLANESGLSSMLTGAGKKVVNYITVTTPAADPEAVAVAVVANLVRAV